MSIKTIVEVSKFAYDAEGNQLDIEGKPIGKPGKKLKDPMIRKEKYYLLHWGLELAIYGTHDNPLPANYTVGICQPLKGGPLETFLPTAITILGKEVK